jgi:transposase
MKRRWSSCEFKVETVKHVRERGLSLAQAGREPDVHEKVLRKWVKEFGSDPGRRFPATARCSRGSWRLSGRGGRSTS